MAESTVRLTNGPRWTAQDFVDHYFRPSRTGISHYVTDIDSQDHLLRAFRLQDLRRIQRDGDRHYFKGELRMADDGQDFIERAISAADQLHGQPIDSDKMMENFAICGLTRRAGL